MATDRQMSDIGIGARMSSMDTDTAKNAGVQVIDVSSQSAVIIAPNVIATELNKISLIAITVPGETDKVLNVVEPYCNGDGVDFGSGLNPVTNARVIVDIDQKVHNTFHGKIVDIDSDYVVTSRVFDTHIRDIDKGFTEDEKSGAWLDDLYDFTYSSWLLGCLRDPQSLLKTMARITKVGGYIILVCPHEDWVPLWNAPAGSLQDLSPRKVVKWLKSAGNVSIIHITEREGNSPNNSFVVIGRKEMDSFEVNHQWDIVPEFAEIYDNAEEVSGLTVEELEDNAKELLARQENTNEPLHQQKTPDFVDNSGGGEDRQVPGKSGRSATGNGPPKT